jgi:ABC-type sugar transport system permease subunit
MRRGLIEISSAILARATFVGVVGLGCVVSVALVYALGNPKEEFAELHADWPSVVSYVGNTALLFALSLFIQAPLFLLGTLYMRRPTNLLKIALILPFATGTIAPAAGFYTLLSSSIGPFQSSWLLTDFIGARFVIALIDAWQWLGVVLFLAFACIERIPLAHFQQATVEGIPRFQQWRLIVWPAIWRVVAIYVAIKALDWTRKFEVIHVLYGDGGPDEAVKTFAMHAAKRYFDAGMQGYAAALALLQLAVLLVCVFVALRTPAIPDAIGHHVGSERGRRGITIGAATFRGVLVAFLALPAFWLLLMSVQQPQAIYRGGFRLWPSSLTPANFTQFAPWRNTELFQQYTWSIIFYGVVTGCAMLLALNETYRLAAHTSPRRERQRLATVIGIFFMPSFALFYAVDLSKSWLAVEFDVLALFVASVTTGYSVGLLTIYAAFKFGFRRQFEQLLLEFRSPALAFWVGIMWPQVWIVCLAAVLVFTTGWNELFLSDKWTSGTGWKPFATIIRMAVEQYKLEYSVLAAGAIISMLTPMALGAILYLLARFLSIFAGASAKAIENG